MKIKFGVLRAQVLRFKFCRNHYHKLNDKYLRYKYQRYKYLINKASIKSEKCHHSIRVDAHIYFFKRRDVWQRLAITAKALKRSAELLLLNLLCVQFMKEEELSAFHASNRKDPHYFWKFLCAWENGVSCMLQM